MFTLIPAVKRRIVLIDIENVVGGGITVGEQVREAQAQLVEACALNASQDQVVVACGRASAEVVGFEWCGPHRFVFRAGIDGADLELLELIDSERIAERFTDLLLVSGDAIFTDAIARLGAAGVNVTIASRPESLSRRMRLAASHTIELHSETQTFLEAA